MVLLFLRIFKVFKFLCESLFFIMCLIFWDYELNKFCCILFGDVFIYVYIWLIMFLCFLGELRFVYILIVFYFIRVMI